MVQTFVISIPEDWWNEHDLVSMSGVEVFVLDDQSDAPEGEVYVSPIGKDKRWRVKSEWLYTIQDLYSI